MSKKVLCHLGSGPGNVFQPVGLQEVVVLNRKPYFYDDMPGQIQLHDMQQLRIMYNHPNANPFYIDHSIYEEAEMQNAKCVVKQMENYYYAKWDAMHEEIEAAAKHLNDQKK